jgi:cystathionine beta-lyase
MCSRVDPRERGDVPGSAPLWTDIGVTASSDDSFLALRGLRTLPVRLARPRRERAQDSEMVADATEVREVIYPALPGSRGHESVEARFHRRVGTVRRGAPTGGQGPHRGDARRACGSFGMGWSWGGFESLIIPIYPERVQTATTWDAGGPCLRLAIGLETWTT